MGNKLAWIRIASFPGLTQLPVTCSTVNRKLGKGLGTRLRVVSVGEGGIEAVAAQRVNTLSGREGYEREEEEERVT